MEGNNVFFRCIMLFYYRNGKNATQTRNKICAVYGEDAVSERMCQKWFAKFRSGEVDIEDASRSGRPVTTDVDQITALIASDRQIATREIAAKLKIGKSTVSEHLSKLGVVKKLDVWVPHNLTEKNLMDRISICNMLYKCNEDDPFLKRIITGDEKWIIYNNIERKRSWSKRGEPPLITSKKVMLSIWWNWKGIIHYELLPNNRSVNSDKYCLQLDQLRAEVNKKCTELVNLEGVIFHHDNARLRTNLQTRQKLLEFGWDILPHPSSSPDITPSDYYLFRSLQNSLNGIRFVSLEHLKNYLASFFAEKTQDFYERGIMRLPERWKTIVQQNGAYITD
ncbi:PREDICTED: histone-lysine N-methyltransferase SETMAR-like [Dinoponera quadriceps]|uniref:Histone-lysine N-methyltransferase SETMAR-like n=1 Tax=Dinoponera quadriceps TaxID=609295 RepID=A0A6P3Y8U6_DINQU|nr:PREDICTED: histone-lysine N-methyltransferase SETMAR-like [Dinoponera quadriceps]